jgi:hypothetical protein
MYALKVPMLGSPPSSAPHSSPPGSQLGHSGIIANHLVFPTCNITCKIVTLYDILTIVTSYHT